jgi:hypothetical protein
MSVVNRISPGSAFKVGLVTYGLLGLVAGVFFSLFALLRAAVPGAGSAGLGGMIFGVFAVIFFPLLYGFFGAVFAALTAVVYNLAASWVGGLSIEVG